MWVFLKILKLTEVFPWFINEESNEYLFLKNIIEANSLYMIIIYKQGYFETLYRL